MPHLIQGKRALHLGALSETPGTPGWRARKFHPWFLGLQPATIYMIIYGDLTIDLTIKNGDWSINNMGIYKWIHLTNTDKWWLVDVGWWFSWWLVRRLYYGCYPDTSGVITIRAGNPNLMPIPSTFAKASKARCRSDPNIASLAGTSILLLVVSPCCVPSVQWFYRTETENWLLRVSTLKWADDLGYHPL